MCSLRMLFSNTCFYLESFLTHFLNNVYEPATHLKYILPIQIKNKQTKNHGFIFDYSVSLLTFIQSVNNSSFL